MVLFIGAIQTIQGQNPMKINSNFRLDSSAQIAFYSDFYGQSPLYIDGEVHINSDSSVIKSPSFIHVHDLTFNSKKKVNIETELQIAGSTTFRNGIIVTDRQKKDEHFIHFLEKTTYTGLNIDSYVDGTVYKTGDESFIFPIGNKQGVNSLSIGESSQPNTFQAYYKHEDVETILPKEGADSCTSLFSPIGYWAFNRIAGSEDVEVSLSYDQGMLANEDQTCNNVVASWNGSKWQSEGNGGISGDNGSGGTISSGVGFKFCGGKSPLTNYSFLTITAASQAFSFQLYEFTGQSISLEKNLINFKTARSQNRDVFFVERSYDMLHWNIIGSLKRKNSFGNSSSHYYIDENFDNSSTTFYRIVRINGDGSVEQISDIISIESKINLDEYVKVFPNPATSFIKIEIPKDLEGMDVRIMNMLGQSVITQSNLSKGQVIQIQSLDEGVYFLEIFDPIDGRNYYKTKIYK